MRHKSKCKTSGKLFHDKDVTKKALLIATNGNINDCDLPCNCVCNPHIIEDLLHDLIYYDFCGDKSYECFTMFCDIFVPKFYTKYKKEIYRNFYYLFFKLFYEGNKLAKYADYAYKTLCKIKNKKIVLNVNRIRHYKYEKSFKMESEHGINTIWSLKHGNDKITHIHIFKDEHKEDTIRNVDNVLKTIKILNKYVPDEIVTMVLEFTVRPIRSIRTIFGI